MGVVNTLLNNATGEKHILQPLFDELNVKNNTSKAVMAALVYGTLNANNCGVSGENNDAVKHKLMCGICDDYLFDIFALAGAWDNDLLDILVEHEPQINVCTFYTEYLWPFLRSTEIVPGVCMPG